MQLRDVARIRLHEVTGGACWSERQASATSYEGLALSTVEDRRPRRVGSRCGGCGRRGAAFATCGRRTRHTARRPRRDRSAAFAPQPSERARGSYMIVRVATGVPPPSKIVAMHLGYRSRAAERGRTPEHPSYFLKPLSSIGASGDPVRPSAGVRAARLRGRGRARHRKAGATGHAGARVGSRRLDHRRQRLRPLRPAVRRPRVERAVQGQRRVHPARPGLPPCRATIDRRRCSSPRG